jgi:hypothetical protein
VAEALLSLSRARKTVPILIDPALIDMSFTPTMSGHDFSAIAQSR